MQHRSASWLSSGTFYLNWQSIIFFACLIVSLTNVCADAATVSCGSYFGTFTAEQAKPRWPSGRAPVKNVTCSTGYLTGEISRGDYKNVLAFLTANEPFFGTLTLNSSGGDVEEALKIGRLLRKHLIETWAPITAPNGPILFAGSNLMCDGPRCTCASACALIWFGGVERMGTVGVHRPWTRDPEFVRLSPAEASARYRRALNDLTLYLNEMEIPQSITELMVATSSDDVRWIDAVDGLERPPSIAEWEDASCGPRPNELFASLKSTVCASRLLDNHRDLGRSLFGSFFR